MLDQRTVIRGLLATLLTCGLASVALADDTPQPPATAQAAETQPAEAQDSGAYGYDDTKPSTTVMDQGYSNPDAPAAAADAPAGAEGEAKPEGKAKWGGGGNPMGFPNFLKALRESPGCLKADGGKLYSGKLCIFGWFENKEAAKGWYFGDVHQAMLDRFYPTRLRDREPMFLVPDDIPIMGVACYTPPAPGEPGIKQIAVELYTPLHGGFSGGGRFSPDEWKDVFEHYDQYKKDEHEEGETTDGGEVGSGSE